MKVRNCIPLILLCALAASQARPAEKQRTFEIRGKIVQKDVKSFGRTVPIVFLFSSTTPFTISTLVDRGGSFKFKNVPVGLYTMVAAIPMVGEIVKSIEVSPSFADSRGRIEANIPFDRASLTVPPQHGVSTTALSVPEDAKDQYRKAMKFLETSDVENAVKCFKRALEIAPQFVAALNYLGTISYQTRRFQEAESYFREALKADPDAYDPLVNLGGTLLSLQRYKESLGLNQQAVRMRPNDPLAHSQLGQSYFSLGELDKAEVHLKQAKALDASHFSLPQIVLSRIYRLRGNLTGVIRELEEFLRLHPESKYAPEIRKEIDTTRASIPGPPVE